MFYVLMLLFTVTLSGYKQSLVFSSKQAPITHISSLSDEQLAVLNGKGCSFGQWLATIGAWVGCASVSGGVVPVLAACLGAVGGTIDCIDISGNVSNAPPCTDPCPNGGYEEEYSTCQQIGGQILGQSQCSSNPNRICCQD